MEKNQEIKYYPIHKLPRIKIKQEHNISKLQKKTLKINTKYINKK